MQHARTSITPSYIVTESEKTEAWNMTGLQPQNTKRTSTSINRQTSQSQLCRVYCKLEPTKTKALLVVSRLLRLGSLGKSYAMNPSSILKKARILNIHGGGGPLLLFKRIKGTKSLSHLDPESPRWPNRGIYSKVDREP